jgi:4-hydroxymandelate oxidase
VSELPAPTTLAQFERLFDQALQIGPHDYYAGGAGDETTLRENIEAWKRWRIHPSVMVDVTERDPSATILGKRQPHPLIIAPTAYHRLASPNGEAATSEGCGNADAIYTLSTLATARPAQVAAHAPATKRWFQVYVFKDRGVTADLIAEAVETGFEALVVTADLPVLGRRDRDLVNNFVVGQADMVPGVAATGASGLISMQDTADLIDPSLTWSDIEELASKSKLPVLVKGILRPQDAVAAVASGAQGVVVSNHGGRQLDCVPPTAEVLESIVDAIGTDATTIVDGGIRRGSDVLVALALGAAAVMIGRPVLWGLAASGASGVQSVLEILLDEFDRALALSGCPRACDLAGRSDLVRPAYPQAH